MIEAQARDEALATRKYKLRPNDGNCATVDGTTTSPSFLTFHEALSTFFEVT